MNYWAKTRESKLVFRSQLLLIVLAIAVSFVFVRVLRTERAESVQTAKLPERH